MDHFVKICTLTPFFPFCQDLHPDPIFLTPFFQDSIGSRIGLTVASLRDYESWGEHRSFAISEHPADLASADCGSDGGDIGESIFGGRRKGKLE